MSDKRRQMLAVVMVLLAPLGLARAAKVDPYFPSESQVVVTVQVRQILDSALVKKDIPQIKEHLKSVEDAQKVLDDLGFDPFKDLDTIAIASAGATDQEKALIVVHGRFDIAKFKAKADETIKESADILAIEKDGDNTLYKVTVPGQDKALYVGVIDSTTVVAAQAKDAVKDAFAVKADKKKNALKKEFQALLEKADGNKSILIVGMGSALPSVPQTEKIKSLSGWVNMTEEIQAEFTVATENSDAAKDLAKLVEDGIDQGKNLLNLLAMQQTALAPVTGLLDVLKVAQKDNAVVISGKVDKATIEKLQKAK